MKIERLSQDKIRIFLTSDDLNERGIQKEDIWGEIPKVHELFVEVMDQAHSQLGFDVTGPLAVEVFALPAQGMIVIVTRGKYDGHYYDSNHEDDFPDEVYEMEVTLEQSNDAVYCFDDFEVLTQLAPRLLSSVTDQGRLYAYKNKWFLYYDFEEIEANKHVALIALLDEFGHTSRVSPVVLEEYGKVIIAEGAIGVIAKFFKC